MRRRALAAEHRDLADLVEAAGELGHHRHERLERPLGEQRLLVLGQRLGLGLDRRGARLADQAHRFGLGLGAQACRLGLLRGDLGAGLGGLHLAVGGGVGRTLTLVERGIRDLLDVGVELRLLVLGALQQHRLLALGAGEGLGLIGLGAGASDLGRRGGGVLVERGLLDEVRLIGRDLPGAHRARRVDAGDLGLAAHALDLGRAERVDVAVLVGDALDLERVEDEPLCEQVALDALGDLVRQLLPVLHELLDRQRRDDAAQRALELLGRELLDRAVLAEEALRGAADELRVGADLHERDARHVDRDAVGCLCRRLHLDLAGAQ